MASDPVNLALLTDSTAQLTAHLTDRSRRLDARASAEHRVIEYLLALGLTDTRRLLEVTHELLATVPTPLDDTALAEAAVTQAQARVAAFLHDVFDGREDEVHPLWLRAFFSTHPAECLGDVSSARACALSFGDPFAGLPPASKRFAQQSL